MRTESPYHVQQQGKPRACTRAITSLPDIKSHSAQCVSVDTLEATEYLRPGLHALPRCMAPSAAPMTPGLVRPCIRVLNDYLKAKGSHWQWFHVLPQPPPHQVSTKFDCLPRLGGLELLQNMQSGMPPLRLSRGFEFGRLILQAPERLSALTKPASLQ